MTDDERRAQAAMRALQTLERRHEQFLAHITSEADLAVIGGSVTTDGQTLTATTLGVSCTATRRPIAVDAHPVANEYTFFTQFGGEELPIWRLFLDQHGHLFEDSALGVRFGDFDGAYVRANIVVALANKLLQSPVFAPSA